MAAAHFPVIALTNGTTIHVETTVIAGDPQIGKQGVGTGPSSSESDVSYDPLRRESDVSNDGPVNFDDVFKSVEGFAGELNQMLARVKPKAAKVKFGVELGFDSGKLTALIVKGSTKATLEVTLEWG